MRLLVPGPRGRDRGSLGLRDSSERPLRPGSRQGHWGRRARARRSVGLREKRVGPPIGPNGDARGRAARRLPAVQRVASGLRVFGDAQSGSAAGLIDEPELSVDAGSLEVIADVPGAGARSPHWSTAPVKTTTRFMVSVGRLLKSSIAALTASLRSAPPWGCCLAAAAVMSSLRRSAQMRELALPPALACRDPCPLDN